jgi:hypothetical protein
VASPSRRRIERWRLELSMAACLKIMKSSLAALVTLFLLSLSCPVHGEGFEKDGPSKLPRVQLQKAAPKGTALKWLAGLGRPYLGGIKEAVNELALGSHPDYVALNNYLDAQVSCLYSLMLSVKS